MEVLRDETTKRVIRIQKFADRRDISVWTARKWAYEGKIASCKIGRLLYVPESEIERLAVDGMRPRLEA